MELRKISRLKRDKRAALFTILTITILILFAASYTTYTLFEDKSPLNNRIATLDKLVTSIEQDLPRQLYISGYRTILLFNKYIVENSKYINDPQTELEELFFNGTLYGEYQDLMDEATFDSIENFLQTNAQKINANVTLESPSITFSQDDPWNLKVTLIMQLTVQDKGGLATWDKISTTSVYIPISNFDDPVRAKETSGRLLQKINQTPYQSFVTGSDYSALKNHFENSLYKSSTSAPNFLMRLQGDLSSSSTGIESFVNPQELSSVGISVKYKTLIDYIYFSSSSPTKYSVPSVSNLILDDEDNHLSGYNVSGTAVLA